LDFAFFLGLDWTWFFVGLLVCLVFLGLDLVFVGFFGFLVFLGFGFLVFFRFEFGLGFSLDFGYFIDIGYCFNTVKVLNSSAFCKFIRLMMK
jgi:hypothetical protein